MEDESDESEGIAGVHANVLNRLKKSILNVLAINDVRFTYKVLNDMGPWRPDELTMELFMEIDALQTALVISYGRLFVSAEGSSRLNTSIIPEELRVIHEEIMELRHKRFAHHGGHDSIEAEVSFEVHDDEVLVTASLTRTGVIGAPAHWEPLFVWLGEHLREQSDKQLEKLSFDTGKKWKMPEGPPPSWV